MHNARVAHWKFRLRDATIRKKKKNQILYFVAHILDILLRRESWEKKKFTYRYVCRYIKSFGVSLKNNKYILSCRDNFWYISRDFFFSSSALYILLSFSLHRLQERAVNARYSALSHFGMCVYIIYNRKLCIVIFVYTRDKNMTCVCLCCLLSSGGVQKKNGCFDKREGGYFILFFVFFF